MSGSFVVALSGFRGAIGANLNNLNTTGFKRISASFQDAVTDVSRPSERQMGSGVGDVNRKVIVIGEVTYY